MAYLDIISKGIIIGLLASIPLGPIGVMCVQRTINGKFLSGFASGLGAACADTVFAAVALFFFALVSPYIDSHLELLKLVGGLIIAVIGAILFLRKGVPHIRKNRHKKRNLFKDFISIFALTITNPAYILVFIGLFSFMKIGDMEFTPYTQAIMIVSVLIGAVVWWFTLTSLVNLLRKKFTVKHIYYINKFAGAAIFIFGFVAIISSIIDFIAKS